MELIRQRLATRTGHFMNPALLHSQFEALEPPADAPRVEVSGTPEEIAAEVRRVLGHRPDRATRLLLRGDGRVHALTPRAHRLEFRR